MSGLVDYPLLLAEDRWAHLRVPSDVTLREVERIVAMLRTLPVGATSPTPTAAGPPPVPEQKKVSR